MLSLVLCVWLLFLLFFFFFQAEDGIRDLVRSRGLGDVYKRQDGTGRIQVLFSRENCSIVVDGKAKMELSGEAEPAVSYTHLTLPTSDLV